ncbi:DUF359 domain-containing protein [archaeon]|nr:MAG: DUF359 domain-containing protein [archaeon]
MRSGSLKWPPDRGIVFPEHVKKLLREPAGQLISGKPEEVAIRVKRLIEEEKPKLLILVGDYTSLKLKEAGVEADVYVIDGKIERRPCRTLELDEFKVVRVVNEPGTLNPEAASKIDKLLREARARGVVVLVQGEEDLLTLACILSAPEGSMIVYGQPGRGSVIVRVSREVKERAAEILRLAWEE